MALSSPGVPGGKRLPQLRRARQPVRGRLRDLRRRPRVAGAANWPAAKRRRRVPRPQMPRGLTRGRSGDVLFAVVMVVVALFAPPLALLLCGYLAYRFDRDGETMLRNVAPRLRGCRRCSSSSSRSGSGRRSSTSSLKTPPGRGRSGSEVVQIRAGLGRLSFGVSVGMLCCARATAPRPAIVSAGTAPSDREPASSRSHRPEQEQRRLQAAGGMRIETARRSINSP